MLDRLRENQNVETEPKKSLLRRILTHVIRTTIFIICFYALTWTYRVKFGTKSFDSTPTVESTSPDYISDNTKMVVGQLYWWRDKTTNKKLVPIRWTDDFTVQIGWRPVDKIDPSACQNVISNEMDAIIRWVEQSRPDLELRNTLTINTAEKDYYNGKLYALSTRIGLILKMGPKSPIRQ